MTPSEPEHPDPQPSEEALAAFAEGLAEDFGKLYPGWHFTAVAPDAPLTPGAQRIRIV